MSSAGLQNAEDAIAYARRLADLMGLRDWDFALDSTPPTDLNADFPTLAEVDMHPHANHAVVRIAGMLFDQDGEEQRRVIVHELLHCHRARSDYMVHEDLEDLLGKATDRLFWSAYSRQREVEVESVARVLAPFMPLP